MKLLLLYPPQWNPNSPYLALPLLSAQLKKHGYETKIKDINIEFFNHILTESHLKKCLCKARETEKIFEKRIFSEYPDAVENFCKYSISEQTMFLKYKKTAETLSAMTNADSIAKKAENAVKVLKNKDSFYDPEILFDAKKTIQDALKIASLPYAPNEMIYDNYFGNPLMKMDWVNIDYQCKDKSLNMFSEYFEEDIKNDIYKNCDVICITVPDLSQLIPALTLSRILKATYKTPVVIGGNYITQNKDDIINHPEIFDEYCDFMLIGDGEKSIIEFSEFIEGKRKIFEVSNLMYISENKVAVNKPAEVLDFKQVAYADFDDIDFSLYFSPETVIPIQLSKGCYWGKCTFCDYYYGQQCFDIKKTEDVIDELNYFIDRYGIHHFLIIDEAVPPKYHDALADAILKNNLEIYYYSFTRLEKSFTKEVLQKMYSAGFRIALWGYETWSERIMQMMNKGIDNSERIRIMQDARDAGIWNNCLFIMGYPTETLEEVEKTISVMYEHRDIINSCTPSNFSLKKNAILMKFIGTNGLIGFEPNGEFYTVLKDKIEGLSQSERREIRRQFHSDYIQANKHSLWPINYSDTDHILLYLSKYTCDYVSGYRSENNICLQFR